MKKKIILVSIALILLIIAGVFINYLLSFKNVSFTLNSDVSSISIYKKDNYNSKKDPTKLTSSQSIRLQTGDYIIIPSGDKISTNQIVTSITKNTDIIINPDYSESYLKLLQPSTQIIINTILTEKYPEIISNYKITNDSLYIKGEWYGGLLENKKSSDNSKKDVFRFIAHKDNGVWQLVSYPELVLNKNTYKTVPISIVNIVNSLLLTI